MDRTLKSRLLGVLDIVLSIIIIPSALMMYLYRRGGSARLPVTTALLRRIGVFPILDHYYEPLFNPAHFSKPMTAIRYLPGIELRETEQLAFLRKLTHADEFKAFLEAQKTITDDTAFRIDNPSFVAGDADFLFQIIRHGRPRKLIEIGSGSSTKVAKHALALNVADGAPAAKHICIEPYEQPWLEQLQDVDVLRSKVEDCHILWGKELVAGDILFIDSSHMIRPQGDVLHEYLTILPQLASGVLVHVHDIFTPRDYLTRWIEDDVKFWNEQYLLEVLLGNRERYEVVAALNMLKHGHFEELNAVCPTITEVSEPGSFYFRVR
jgi:Methyltransferase domain